MTDFCKFMSRYRFDLWDALWWTFGICLMAYHWPIWTMLPVGVGYLVISIASYIHVGGRRGLGQ